MSQVDPAVKLTDALHRAVAQAVLAPSTYNSQPWRFRVRGDTLDLLADRDRALPIVDREGRELTMSCGAALFHLRMALRAESLDVAITRMPDPTDRALLARVVVRPGKGPTVDEGALARAIPGRHTARAPYLGITLPEDFIARAQREAEAEDGRLVVIADEAARVELIALVMEGDHQHWRDPEFRRELSSWMRPNDSTARDGLFGFAEGLENVASHLAPLSARFFDRSAEESVHDRDLALASPTLAVLCTEGDTPSDWLRAGEALDRVLLRAEHEDVAVSYLNQPVQVPELRPRLREIAGQVGYPQAVLRMGYGPDGPVTPRREVADVLR
jgi:nitroreductase